MDKTSDPHTIDLNKNPLSEEQLKKIADSLGEVELSKEVLLLIRKPLGHAGRMIGGSKSGYSHQYPHNFPVFNANLCTERRGKIWYGDLDLTLDGGKLQEVSKLLEEPVYVLREADARFRESQNPDLKKAVARYTAEGGELCRDYDRELFEHSRVEGASSFVRKGSKDRSDS